MKASKIFIFNIFWITTTVCQAQYWSPMNAHIKVSSSLKVIDDKLYMCGIDTMGLNSNRLLSVYDGITYDTSLGVAYGGPVYSFEKYNGDIYMGGSFLHIGNPIPNIILGIHTLARWDGTNFDSIGAFPDPNHKVDVLQVYNNELYIGGKFQNGAGLGISNLMKYDGANFSSVGGGIVGNFTEVWSMVVYNGDLIVAGSFYSAGGVPVDNIARWDGTQWHQMGDGLGPYIFCMTVDTISNILYAGGNVGWSGSNPIEKVAYWDGLNWQQVGSGIPQVPNLQTLCMYKGELYAGTGESNQSYPDRIKKWNGQVWQALNSYPTDRGVYKLNEFQGSLFATGNFNEIDSVCCYWGLAYYTDTTLVEVQELEQNNDNFNIYPNPSYDKITLLFNHALIGKLEVKIYEYSSTLVLSKFINLTNDKVEIVLPKHLKPGVYICTVVQNGNEFTKKFIIGQE